MSDLGADPRPSVVLPREVIPLPLAIGLGAIMALGLLVFLLSNRQTEAEREVGQQGAIQKAPPALVVPLPPLQQRVTTPFFASVIQQRPPMPKRESRPDPLPAMSSYSPPRDVPLPAQSINEDLPSRSPDAGGSGMPIVIDLSRARGGSGGRPNDPDDPANAEQQQRDADTVRAIQIRSRAATIPQGAIIAAVLETPLNSDRPGLARAIISQDVRGFDGTRVLIPRGSRLIGEFKAEVSPGLRRIPVIWTRLIRPDGVAIRIASPGGDPLGGAGLGGRVNTHFAQRLLGAVLQSVMTVGVNVLSNSSSIGGNPIFVGVPGQAQQAGEQIAPKTDRPPTVSVRAGAEISVLVSRDLDFSGTPAVR